MKKSASILRMALEAALSFSRRQAEYHKQKEAEVRKTMKPSKGVSLLFACILSTSLCAQWSQTINEEPICAPIQLEEKTKLLVLDFMGGGGLSLTHQTLYKNPSSIVGTSYGWGLGVFPSPLGSVFPYLCPEWDLLIGHTHMFNLGVTTRIPIPLSAVSLFAIDALYDDGQGPFQLVSLHTGYTYLPEKEGLFLSIYVDPYQIFNPNIDGQMSSMATAGISIGHKI
jgi:hypothetical protein